MILENFRSAIPTLLVIFCLVFCSIIITRAIFTFLLYQARKKYQNLKKISNKIIAKKLKKIPKEDDELFIKKTLENSLNKNLKDNRPYEIISSQAQENDLKDTKIVDIVKPIGFFTSMILGQKLTYLIQSAQIINKRENKGFWVSMIEAQERAAGRQHGRGR